jgi:hypothetical protein
MPFLLTRKGTVHSYSNASKIAPCIHHLLEHRDEFSGQSYNFVDSEPVALDTLILTIKSLLNLRTPRKIYLPYPLAKTGKNLIHWLISKLGRIGIEARMPGELLFLENFYKDQTLSPQKLFQSSYQDPQPEVTVFSQLPELLEYYLTRWEHLNLITRYNKEFYAPKNNLDDFKVNPKELRRAATHKDHDTHQDV